MFYHQVDIFCKPTVQNGEKSIRYISASQNKNFQTIVCMSVV